MSLRGLALALTLSLLVRAAAPAGACGVAPPRGAEVAVADEEAVIVWDPDHQTEQFIRKAAFRSTALSFGFLVPTPTVPDLGEVDDLVFSNLAEAIRPEVKYETKGWSVDFNPWLFSFFGAMSKGSEYDAAARRGDDVHVIQTAHVAGFDATTLEADDPNALSAWLGQHGYDASPALTAWLGHYVADHWKITAFVVATDQKTASTSYEVATRAVRMTFHTERPFYPYREPEAPASTEPRLLRVWVFAPARYAGTLVGQPWSAKVLYAAPMAVPSALAQIGGKPVLSVFSDASSPRRGIDEIYFAPSADQAEIRQPPFVVVTPHTVTIPLDGVLVVAIVGVWVIARRRRRNRASAS